MLENREQGARSGGAAGAGGGGIGGREREKKKRVIKSKAQRQNKFQKANVAAISGMTQIRAWPAPAGCGVGIRSDFLSVCHLLGGSGLVFPFDVPGASLQT